MLAALERPATTGIGAAAGRLRTPFGAG